MRYTLLFDDRQLGTVDEEDADFPTFFGRYELLRHLAEAPEWRHVLDYIAYSVRTWPLWMDDRIDEVPSEEEEQFIDLIESNAWSLRDAGGNVIPILIPIFGTDSQINWRLDPQR